ncbi:MAG: hypothetical protein JWN34_1998 [Bryobacterales bacterium]|nr:hypothetical protein [Bryobacterales bacterium]
MMGEGFTDRYERAMYPEQCRALEERPQAPSRENRPAHTVTFLSLEEYAAELAQAREQEIQREPVSLHLGELSGNGGLPPFVAVRSHPERGAEVGSRAGGNHGHRSARNGRDSRERPAQIHIDGAAGMMTRNVRQVESEFRQGDKLPHLTVSSDRAESVGNAVGSRGPVASNHPGMAPQGEGTGRHQSFTKFVIRGAGALSSDYALSVVRAASGDSREVQL